MAVMSLAFFFVPIKSQRKNKIIGYMLELLSVMIRQSAGKACWKTRILRDYTPISHFARKSYAGWRYSPIPPVMAAWLVA